MENEKRLIFEDLTYKIRGCIFNVYNSLGFGHKENVYQKALELELQNNGISYESQKILNVYYKERKVGVYVPDLIIEQKIILEIKATEFDIKRFETQLLNYIKGTNYKLGLLVNFGKEKLSIKRLIN